MTFIPTQIDWPDKSLTHTSHLPVLVLASYSSFMTVWYSVLAIIVEFVATSQCPINIFFPTRHRSIWRILLGLVVVVLVILYLYVFSHFMRIDTLLFYSLLYMLIDIVYF